MIISYYTPNYAPVMEKYLMPTIQKFNLESDIQAVSSLGNWQNNTKFKPSFILSMLDKHKKDLIWIDADATIEQYPALFWQIPQEYDIAVYYLDWFLHWKNKPNQPIRELVSATMMFRYNDKVMNLVYQWRQNCRDNNTGTWEQKILEQTLMKHTEINVYNLPNEYCCILLQDNSIPKYIQNPVIIQHQASREYKRKQ